jgi:hypothetical protein
MILVNSGNLTATVSTTSGTFQLFPHSSTEVPGTLLAPLPTGVTVKEETVPGGEVTHSAANTLKTEVTLTAADLLALDATPIELVSAPGAGKLNYVVGFLFESIAGDASFASTNPLDAYIGSVGSIPSPTTTASLLKVSPDMNALLRDAAVNTIDTGQLNVWSGDGFDFNADPTAPSASLENQPVCLYATGAIVTGTAGAITTATRHTAGTGYVVGDTGTVSGAGNADATYEIATVDGLVGAILTSSKNSGGADYVQGDTGTINTGGTAATYVIDSVDAGAVLTYHLTSAGAGYSPGTGVATTKAGAQEGIGAGFTVDIATVAVGAVVTFTIEGGGTGYDVANNIATAKGGAQQGSGTGFKVNVTGVDPTPSDYELKVTTLYNVLNLA